MADANLGRANVEIRATLDKLDGDLSKARGAVDSAVKRIAQSAGQNFQTLGKLTIAGIGAGATAAMGAITGLGAVLSKLALDAAPLEGVRAAFDGVAKSAEIGGDAMLDALQKGSAGMISQRDLMLSFNKAAQLVSTDFAVQLPDAMQYLGKVSAATGTDMNYLLDSLVTGVGRLSPMILDNLSIQVTLAEATARAAEMYGVQESALSKAQVQAGMMSVSLEKLATNTASMPDVTETAAAKMERLKATFQDAKDEIGIAFLPVLSELAEAVLPLLERALPPIAEGVGRLAEAISPVIEAIGNFAQRISGGMDPMLSFKMLLYELVPPEITARIMEIVAGVQEFIGTAMEALAPVMAWISENIKLQDVLIALGAAVLSVVIPAITPIIGAVAGVIAVFVAAVAIAAGLRAAWESNFLNIQGITQTVWGFIQTFVPQAIQTVQQIVTNVVTAIQTFWAQHGETIKATAQSMWDGVIAIVEWFVGIFKTSFDRWSMAFQGDWRGFGEKIRETWDAAWVKIEEIGETAWQAIKDFFANTDWGSLGLGILEGIAKGITAGYGALRQAARDAAQAALDAAKGFLGIQSPSTVAALQIGMPFSEGIGEGLLKALPSLSWAAQKASVELMQQMERSLLEPRVTHMQLTQERSGFGQINIYGLTLEGVQDRRGLLSELQGLT